MALIKCPECNREISNQALTCIHCGCPLGLGKKHNNLTIKALKHPYEDKPFKYTFGQPMYFSTQNLYVFTTNGNKIAEILSGSIDNLNIFEPVSIYVTFYEDDKDCKHNQKTKSNIITINPEKETKIQIGYKCNAINLQTKLIISEVNTIN